MCEFLFTNFIAHKVQVHVHCNQNIYAIAPLGNGNPASQGCILLAEKKSWMDAEEGRLTLGVSPLLT